MVGITMIIMIHPLGIINIHTKSQGYLEGSWILLRTKVLEVVDQLTAVAGWNNM